MSRPDPAPIIAALQALLERGSCWAEGGLDPETGLGCYGLIWWAYGLGGIALPPTAEEGQHYFTIVPPPYQPWDLMLARFPHEAAARHVALLTHPPGGFHCTAQSNGVARFSLNDALWRRILQHGLRYTAWV